VDQATKENYTNVQFLVENYFALDKDSINRFKENLYNQDIDEVYKNLINQDDLRLNLPLTMEDMQYFDAGWKTFKEYFIDFINMEGLTYEEFVRGSKLVNKNLIKLSKILPDFYITNRKLINDYLYDGWDRYVRRHFSGSYEKNKREIDKAIHSLVMNTYNETSGNKFSKKSNDWELVLSLNYADWFLSATAESWTSCLNFESRFGGAYYTGLPGTIVDKNRALLYLSNGVDKEYKGIKTKRILNRSWVILDNQDRFNVVRFLPSDINIDLIKHKIDGDWTLIPQKNRSFISKHPVNFLKYTSGDSCFIYQDNTRFTRVDDYSETAYFKNAAGGGGYYHFNKNGELTTDVIFSYGDGLSHLIDNSRVGKKKSFKHYYYGHTVVCSGCSERLFHEDEDEIIPHRGRSYCRDCYNEYFTECSICNGTVHRNNAFNHDDDLICESCYSNLYVSCASCWNAMERATGTEIYDGNLICNNCVENNSVTCTVCDRLFPNNQERPPVAVFVCRSCEREQIRNEERLRENNE